MRAFGGVDLLIDTAALFPSSPTGSISDAQCALTLDVNVTANYLLADEVTAVFKAQSLPVNVVLTRSANAVMSKRGSGAYHVSKAALSHPGAQAGGRHGATGTGEWHQPATVVKGRRRSREVASLTKYQIAFGEDKYDDELRTELAQFYTKRTLTHVPIDPKDCAPFPVEERTGVECRPLRAPID